MTPPPHRHDPAPAPAPARSALRPRALPTTRDYLLLSRGERTTWAVLLGAMIALGALNIDLYLPAFPQLQDDLATSSASVQVTLTGALIGFAVAQLFIGPLSDAVGRRTPLIAGLALFTVASLLAAAAPSVEVLVLLRVLQGVGVAGASVIALAVVNDLFDGAGAARLVARLILVLGVAPVFAPSIGSYVLELTDWRGIFVVLSLLGAALLAVGLARMPETLPPERRSAPGVRSSLATYRTLLRDRPAVGLMLTAGLTISALFSYIAGAPFVLQELYGLSTREFSLAFAAIGAALIVGSQVTGQLVTRVPAPRLLVLGLSGAFSAAVLLTVLVLTDTGGLPALLVTLLLAALATGVAMPTAPAIILARHGATAGSASALLGFFQFGLAGVWVPLITTFGLRGDTTKAVAMTSATGLALVGYLAFVRGGLADPRPVADVAAQRASS